MAEDRSVDPCQVVVGVDIGGTKTALMVADVAAGSDLHDATFPTPADASPDAFVAQLVACVREAIGKAGREPGDLAAVGVAVPGLTTGDGRVIRAGNLTGWFDVPLRDLLSHELGVPAFVEQDANAAALGERWRGCAKEINNFVFLALGTGVGAGVVINGRLHRGFRHAAGEVGNFLMGREFLGRDRGGHGNLEQLVGGKTLRAEAREATGEGAEPSAAEATERAREDPRLRDLADEVADYVAMAVVNIAAMLDPEAIIFGGGTTAAGEDLLGPVRERVERELPERPALMRSVLGTEAQLHGAVFGALWELDPDLAMREELR